MAGIFTQVHLQHRNCRQRMTVPAVVVLAMALCMLAPRMLWAGNVGGTVWEDPDSEATARAVQIHLIRLASDDPRQVEQAQLGIESLGLNALAPLQAALAAADTAPAVRAQLQPIVDRLLDAAVLTVVDEAGRPIAHQVFDIEILRQTLHRAAAADAVTTVFKSEGRLAASSDGQGRLVLPGIRPVQTADPATPQVADGGAAVVLARRDRQPVDGVATRIRLSLHEKRAGAILARTVQLPRGVIPRLQVVGDRRRPLAGAAVLFFPADPATWIHSRLNTGPFAFDAATKLSHAEQGPLLAQSRLWNPLSAAALQLGCCSPVTDTEGLLQVGRLAPGRYALQVIAAGYQRLTVAELAVPETIAEDAEPTVLSLAPAPRSFCAGTLRNAGGQPLKFALAFLLPAGQVYDPTQVLELQDFERRRADQRRAEALRAGKNPADLPPAAAVPAYSAATVPLDFIEEIKEYPQVRAARSQASGRIEFRDLAAGQYVLRVFVGSADSMEPADLREWLPADGNGAPTIAAKDGGPVDLGALQYQLASTPAPVAGPPESKEGDPQ